MGPRVGFWPRGRGTIGQIYLSQRLPSPDRFPCVPMLLHLRSQLNIQGYLECQGNKLNLTRRAWRFWSSTSILHLPGVNWDQTCSSARSLHSLTRSLTHSFAHSLTPLTRSLARWAMIWTRISTLLGRSNGYQRTQAGRSGSGASTPTRQTTGKMACMVPPRPRHPPRRPLEGSVVCNCEFGSRIATSEGDAHMGRLSRHELRDPRAAISMALGAMGRYLGRPARWSLMGL